jgi:flavin-dependent dehydrogenase
MLTSYICNILDNKSKNAIVGLGLAGATAFLFLSKHGIEYKLFDKAIFLREKTCEDVLTMEVYRALNKLDPALVEEFVKPSGSAFMEDLHGREVNFDYRVEVGSIPLVCRKEVFF